MRRMLGRFLHSGVLLAQFKSVQSEQTRLAQFSRGLKFLTPICRSIVAIIRTIGIIFSHPPDAFLQRNRVTVSRLTIVGAHAAASDISLTVDFILH